MEWHIFPLTQKVIGWGAVSVHQAMTTRADPVISPRDNKKHITVCVHPGTRPLYLRFYSGTWSSYLMNLPNLRLLREVGTRNFVRIPFSQWALSMNPRSWVERSSHWATLLTLFLFFLAPQREQYIHVLLMRAWISTKLITATQYGFQAKNKS